MSQPLTKPSQEYKSPKKRFKRRNRNLSPHLQEKANAATIASNLQLQEEKRDLIYSSISLAMKFGFFLIAIASLFNLGIASHHRIRRNMELSSLLNLENQKFKKLHLRFDKLFTIGGKDRLMDEQDQWITPNSIRIIWR